MIGYGLWLLGVGACTGTTSYPQSRASRPPEAGYLRAWPAKSLDSRDLHRVLAIAACCLLAALAPFYAGLSSAVLGLVPLGLAIWLASRSNWSARTRVTTSLAVLVITIALFVGLLAVVLRYYNN